MNHGGGRAIRNGEPLRVRVGRCQQIRQRSDRGGIAGGVVKVDDEGIALASNQPESDDRAFERIEVLNDQSPDRVVRAVGLDNPDERLWVEPRRTFPAGTEEAVLNPAGEDGLRSDRGPHGVGESGFVEPPVQLDDHADLLVREPLRQQLQRVPGGESI
jgi:hypothetical protein